MAAGRKNATRANIVEFKGLQDAGGVDGVEFGGFIESLNVDISKDGKPFRRPGRTQVYNGAVTDVWGDGEELLFLTSTGDLRRMSSDETSEVVRSGVTGAGRLAAARVAHTVYWSYGIHTGVIEYGTDRTFGLPQLPPAGVTTVSGSAELPGGVYRYAWAVLTADGEEGPVGLRGTFELATDGGVELLPPITTHARAARVRAFITEPNGTQLFRLGDVETPANTSEQANRTIAARTKLKLVRPHRDHKVALPEFKAAGVHNGRLLVGYENLLLYSDRFDYEYFKPDEMFVPFQSAVRIIAPVEGGVFVGTETDHFFLAGDDIVGAALIHKSNYGAVANTLDYLEQKEHGFEAAGRVAVWVGERGPIFGLSGGQMEDTGDGVVSFTSDVVYGSGAVRKYEGDMHYVSVVRHRGTN